MTTAQPSHFHRLSSDELWIHCGGGVTQLLTLLPAGRAASVLLGSALQVAHNRGYQSQAVVSAGDWQAARVVAGAVDWSLVSCVVSPGFAYADFELAARDSLLAAYPAVASDIIELTR
ncbi:MAG: cupin domain-containing protein [Thermoleophilia bacterium]